MNDMDYRLLELMADGREYTVGEVAAAASLFEANYVDRVRHSMRRLYERGYVRRRGRGLPMYRITLDGRDCLFARRLGVLL